MNQLIISFEELGVSNESELLDSVALSLPLSVKVPLDPAEDSILAPGGKVSYEQAASPIVVTNNGVEGSQTGLDHVVAFELVGGSGDDVLSGFDRLVGGRGDDLLIAGHFASGGAGDDTLITDNSGARVRLLGDGGDDTFIIRHQVEATGGAGRDVFRFESDGWGMINDLSAGDRIDLTALFAAKVERPWDGYLMAEISGGYTTLWFDPDGGGDAYASLITLKGVFTDLSDYLVL
ncbi:calcium-binding protein [Caulobacter endophyticus]|uniref:Peptidase M10 serralysin C-terminal domain-containing protein n=1 Tax=Caulobacter endophyticus TaxID=2172652 RepID=A0A2T9JTV0_9CAUL|nr:hypothetical protein [Caulobacter endophyticus]PVM87124.1 hypothetical protein DDF67_15030 [Caulobacter endophyticus]